MKQKMFIFFSAWLLMSYVIPKQDDKINISAIALADLDGNAMAWEDLKGKTVVLNFWATWCKPCIKEMPSMDRAYQLLKDEDVVFLAASDEAPEEIRSFTEKQNFSFLFVQMKTTLRDLGIHVLPTTLVIDEEGTLVKTVVGSRVWDTQEMLNTLQQVDASE